MLSVLIRHFRVCIVGMLCFQMLLLSSAGYGQSAEAQQLLLNVEKLSQLKNILADMKKGYLLISNGYKAVKDIAEGNFSLHEVFLDGMMLVSPEIKKYHKVADIITDQGRIVSEYKRAFKRFQASENFSESDIAYMAGVYKQLFELSMDNLDELLMVITASNLRMSDQERLAAIDRIFADTEEKLLFLRAFNGQATMLDLGRNKERADVKGLSDVLRRKN
ncbi:TerB family tellurite resistance protein [Pedobacter sp. KBS0701]|uniref:TerB family tellurite resistance protein n=1 Tax=Pedobacter sp. KBS0701 TaxID=2578106 RepID=UPI00143DCD8F|nr:TerB family tellurite resistance protein [Pedobacter sp. KBS0701]